MTAALLLAAGLAAAAPVPAKAKAAPQAPSAPAPQARPPFAEVVRCGEAPGGWCVSPAFPPEQSVEVMGEPCRGVTRDRSRIEWTDCKAPEVGYVAMVGVPAQRFLRLRREKTPPGVLKRLLELVYAQKGFAARMAQTVDMRRRAYGDMDREYPDPVFIGESFGNRGHFVAYDMEALPHVVAGKTRVIPVTLDPNRCAMVWDGFLAGEKAYLHVKDCACGSGSVGDCRPAFFPLDP